MTDWIRTMALGATLSLGLGAAALAQDGSKDRIEDRKEIREDRSDLHQDRKDIRSDKKDIHQDEKDLHGDRKDAREDRKDIREDKAELKDDRKDGDKEDADYYDAVAPSVTPTQDQLANTFDYPEFENPDDEKAWNDMFLEVTTAVG